MIGKWNSKMLLGPLPAAIPTILHGTHHRPEKGKGSHKTKRPRLKTKHDKTPVFAPAFASPDRKA